MKLITQLIGLIAMFFSVFSFQMNKHKQLMLMQILACLFFGIQYYLLGAYTGMILDIVCILRGIVFYHRDKKWAQGSWWILFFMLLVAGAGILTWQGPNSLFVILAMVLNTYSFSCTKPFLVRSTVLLSSPFLLVYNILTGSIGGIVTEILAEISAVTGVLRYDLPALKHSRKSDNTEDAKDQ